MVLKLLNILKLHFFNVFFTKKRIEQFVDQKFGEFHTKKELSLTCLGGRKQPKKVGVWRFGYIFKKNEWVWIYGIPLAQKKNISLRPLFLADESPHLEVGPGEHPHPVEAPANRPEVVWFVWWYSLWRFVGIWSKLSNWQNHSGLHKNWPLQLGVS